MERSQALFAVNATVIATTVPEEINLYREFPRSLDSCSRIIMMWDQFLSRKGIVPMQFLCFCLEGVCTRVEMFQECLIKGESHKQWCPGFAECSDPSLSAAVRVRCLGFSQGKSSTFQMKSKGIGQGGRIQWLTVKWWNDISRSLDKGVIFLHNIYLWSILYTALKSTYPPPSPSILVQNSRVCLGLGHRQSVHTATKERVRDALKGGACDFFQIWLYP